MLASSVHEADLQKVKRLTDTQKEQVFEACGRIAPTWPLDEMIAVNPWWEMRQEKFADVSAKVAALSQTHCLMPKSYFQQTWMESIFPEHLQQALDEADSEWSVSTLEHYLIEDDKYCHWHNISDFVDSGRDRKHKMAWRDEITQQISQFCADFFRIKPDVKCYAEGYKGMYRSWLDSARHDRGIEILMAEDGLTEQFEHLPERPEELLSLAFEGLGVEEKDIADYAHALLLDVNGWASWVAYLRWQDNLRGHENLLVRNILAIRVAWEWVLWCHQKDTDRSMFNEMKIMWRQQFYSEGTLLDTHKQEQAKAWIWQRAAEIAYQTSLHEQLKTSECDESSEKSPRIEAAFCIDVRSEVIRRALEAQSGDIQTIGFAGFFGLPVEYSPIGADVKRPQLPGLLKPAITVKPKVSEKEHKQIAVKLNEQARWIEWGYTPPATFTMVEATGLKYAFKMLQNSLFPKNAHHPVNDDLPLGDEFELTEQDEPLSLEKKVQLAAAILKGMELDNTQAEQVYLVGHGSTSCNNPHAAAYDCGACGGQTGEVNVRVLAFLLNDAEVRAGLIKSGIATADSTQFIAAMHNTTTDEFTFYNAEINQQTKDYFKAATQQAQKERAVKFGLQHLDATALDKAYRYRAKDWSQVRPEWGLAGNASFIIAPRDRTRGLNLNGRAFLHDYDCDKDKNGDLLVQIMTAPMVVANWINLQYYASTCDNHVYGSGNKILHNVVDGSIGVFEGNGGDLRIGLPMQSIHDGENWVHEPLRLSVYVTAPRNMIEQIAEEHQVVKDLIDNDWLYLFRWSRSNRIERFYEGHWLSP
ncbi:MAG: Hypothetical transmembrane protein coupled to NADH-ubiquinone oxidoreductase chain 5 homolog [uncultured Thiotrichaceae bacterium]|uniref:Probable inorganic carbon transporter subunit DabA n=1 Tax=uncultured Thiotrichaceae bacterium TaxID=298394 RepID=A0A6S6SPI9_9GAMM|nr:MAG: Hypothetical transmembrane protein coupled to NADH-ubiquinone oxidoreductase chain 5 homolog [uncultured Thiotrichaceae bacterium]